MRLMRHLQMASTGGESDAGGRSCCSHFDVGNGVVVGVRPTPDVARLTLAARFRVSAAVDGVAGGAGWNGVARFLWEVNSFHCDSIGVSALFLVLLCVGGGAGAIYALTIFEHRYPDLRARSAWWSACS